MHNISKSKFVFAELSEITKRFFKMVLRKEMTPKRIGNVLVLKPDEGNDFLLKSFESDCPFLSVRFGAVELRLFYHLIKKELGLEKEVPGKWRKTAFLHAGIFSFDDESMDFFRNKCLETMQNADLFLVWGNLMESFFLKECKTKRAKRFYSHLDAYESYLYNTPWTLSLKGKKVLVVSPFVESIKQQYMKKNLIFEPPIIPDFESISFVKSPQTINQESVPDGGKWIDTYKELLSKCLAEDFEVALIGCGGYGMILANDLYLAGKKAIHLGGVTQTLFGVLGKRWEERDYMKKYINDQWVRPGEKEKPTGYEEIEEGCYW